MSEQSPQRDASACVPWAAVAVQIETVDGGGDGGTAPAPPRAGVVRDTPPY